MTRRLRPARWPDAPKLAAVAVATLLTAGGLAAGPAVASLTSASGLQLPAPKEDVASFTWDLPQGEPASLDPARGSDTSPQTVTANMCESLLRMNPNLSLGRGLATSWSHPNALTWVYDIRKGVTFWDGHSMTAADVAYSLERNLDPRLGEYWELAYGAVRSIKQSGPYQVTVKLKAPDGTFQQLMATPAGSINEEAYVKRVGTVNYGTPHGGLMCTGPFELQKWNPGNDIVMVKNPHYWDPAYSAHADKVTFDFLTDTNTLVEALDSGEIDGAYTLPPGGVSALKTAPSGNLYSSSTSLGPFYELDAAQDTGPIANPLVRRALSLAIPRTEIADALIGGGATPLLWQLPPAGMESPAVPAAAASTYRAALAKLPDQNVALATKLVREAGHQRPIVLAILQGDETELRISTVLQSAAASIGLKLTIKQLTSTDLSNTFFEASARKGIDLIWDTNWLGTASPLSLIGYYVGPNATLDLTNYKNSQLNADLNAAEAATSPVSQAKDIAPVLTDMSQSAVVIPIAATNSLTFLNSKLTGAVLTEPYYLNSPWAALIGGAK